MNLIHFPAARVIEINAFILATEPGNKGAPDKGKLEGALSRIDNAMLYEGLDDVFEIAAKYALAIAQAHALSDANKRTGLMVALEYLSLNDFEVNVERELMADAMVDLVLGTINDKQFADLLYDCFLKGHSSV
ncbi:type II toxin-antitoxin system death-on-curing family toxin [Rheinheimera riviphila]|uniref:Type II toxin-antitoxin system death-on-curing family toxin n=1 Tax=Rheinheimera riviphila TaxID=1834037 RepID=A0A437R557_9GAMM|nr:type II toxin-antitoxin system death-on-curing family toxin [Rheinheimera riviphila]RVU41919.1 type II toxin-antitoxin system death-on-curing family toxin [Rheinheimera riviphila]